VCVLREARNSIYYVKLCSFIQSVNIGIRKIPFYDVLHLQNYFSIRSPFDELSFHDEMSCTGFCAWFDRMASSGKDLNRTKENIPLNDDDWKRQEIARAKDAEGTLWHKRLAKQPIRLRTCPNTFSSCGRIRTFRATFEKYRMICNASYRLKQTKAANKQVKLS